MPRAGGIDGLVYCPVNKAALLAAENGCADELHWMARYLDYAGSIGKISALEGIWTSQVTGHIPINEVASTISVENVFESTRLLHHMLQKAGLDKPRLCVCSLNPICQDEESVGAEEAEVILPSIIKAKAEGMDLEGPVSAVSAFDRAQSGGIDGIVTMYHDQGQIAMKLMGYDRGVIILGGLPFPITTPAHGTAFDIAGRGIASIDATLAAFTTLVPMAHRHKAMAR